MQFKTILRLLTIWQLCALSQNSHVQEARQRIRAEVRAAVGPPPSHHHHPHHYHHHHHHQQQGWHHQGQRVHRWPSGHGKRWSGRRKSLDRHHFSGWSAWSACDGDCVKRRERFCRVKRKCGYTKHLEERKCGGCHPTPVWHPVVTSPAHHDSGPQTIHHTTSNSPSIIINAAQNGPYLVPTQPSSPPPTESPTVPPTVPPTSSPTWPPTSSPTWSSSPQPSLPPPPHSGHRHIRLPVLQEIERHPPRFVDTPPASHEWGELPSVNDDDNVFHGHHVIDTDDIDNENNGDDDFYVINTRPRYKKKRKPIMIEVDDYDDLVLEAEEEDEVDNQLLASTLDAKRFAGPVRSIRTGSERGRGGKKNKQGRQQEREGQRQRQGRDQSQLQRQGKNRKQQGQGQSQQQVRDQSQQQVRDQSQQRQGRSHQLQPLVTQRSLAPHADDGIEGDIFQYEDFDFDQEPPPRSFGAHDEYGDSYEDDYVENRNGSLLHHLPSKEKATPDALIPKHRRIYSKWSRWTKCSPKCTTRRYKKCRVREQCGREVLREIAYCYTEGSFCQQWLQAQVQKTPPYELRPVTASRRRDITGDGPQSNAIVSDYIMHGKGYRGPEYTPQKLKCGIAPIRSNRRNMYNMLKIIGGKAARKGEWPWQVAIFNRFKEAFCGGTLIAPQWVLTAAHCVRKVLYVRLGEHNLDYEDGTEQQLRVLRSYKHPNFDKKTVDSDVALLRLPKPVNTTTWIGFSCLPRPYQPLPKNMDCTVIGWGKRRNRDVAGTSVLHQAEVPIIPMDNCRSVYHDYTITKNMFCAGHKRGRIDTCAGDSGGPLLCRDTTKPNHPWTIFGITSFGDGCAKRNKFGIYAKVPNYVDWVWSVVNCNGNCKLHQRGYSN